MQTPGDLRPFKLRIEDYELLDGAGAFDGCKVELIDGVIVAVQSEAMPHTRIKNQLMIRLDRALRALGSSLEAYVEPTLALPPHNMPEPDVIVAAYDPAVRYLGLDQARIVIEVGASSLRGDLSDKRDMYARQGVPEYWVVAVEARQLHQFWRPEDGAYAEARVVPLAGPLASATVPGLAVDGSGMV